MGIFTELLEGHGGCQKTYLQAILPCERHLDTGLGFCTEYLPQVEESLATVYLQYIMALV